MDVVEKLKNIIESYKKGEKVIITQDIFEEALKEIEFWKDLAESYECNN